MSPRSPLSDFADWALGLRPRDIPERVLSRARCQLLSVLASLYPGRKSRAGDSTIKAALRLGTTGAATVLPTGERVSPYAAVLANAALSMAHDYDDYLFLGHTGHSAVLGALSSGEEVDASLEEVLVAQVAANEIAGRLGAYVAIGPQNGQLWAHIHLAAAAIAAARLRGLRADEAAHALAIAFYQPPFTLFAGFMASEAKVLTAAQPAATGLFAASLAAEGMRGNVDILEHDRGFARNFAFIPVPDVLGGLGEAWVTDTMSCKIYPGCAYIDGPVDAALAATAGETLRAEEIVRVDVEATHLTATMEAIAEESAPQESLDPITINFSARRSVAIALLAGRLSPDLLDGGWLAEHGDEVRQVAARVHVHATADKTRFMLEGIGEAIPPLRLARSVGARRAWHARRQILDAYLNGPRAERPRSTEVRNSSSTAVRALASFLQSAGWSRGALDMGEVDFQKLEFRFGADVAIALGDGCTLLGTRAIPRGAAGGGLDELRRLMEAKLETEASAAGYAPAAAALEELLARPAEEVRAREVTRAVCQQ